MAAIVLSSIQGGVGKTTVAAGLAAALTLQGCEVSCFSIGPGLAAHRPEACCRGKLPQHATGLDGWLLSCDAARACFHSLANSADLSVIEGCLGMFDSPTADGSEQGSTAQMAAWLQVPVVLIIDAQAFNTARAIVALVRGYAAGESSCSIAGVILNKVSKQALAADAQTGLLQAGLDVVVLGALPNVPGLETSSSTHACSRATAAASNGELQEHVCQPCPQQGQLAQLAADHVDLQQLRGLAAKAAVPKPLAPLPPAARTLRVSVGIAYDEAFFQYFQQNLHMLQVAGVQLVPFSPLHDSHLPSGLSAVLLGGSAAVADCAQQLAANTQMLEALRAFAGAGGLVIGEAGGLMYLSRSVQLQQSEQQLQRHAMVGLFPFHTVSQPPGAEPCHAYVSITVKQQAAHPLLIPGSKLRGVATCCCQVLEERPVGSLSAALAAAAAASSCSGSEQQAVGRGGRCSTSSCGSNNSSAGGSNSSTDAPVTPPPFGSIAAGSAGPGHGNYTYSYSCVPLSEASSNDSAVAPVEEGYTYGSALASAVQVHYGSCPELVQHLVQRCLRVDVASVTAAARAAASQAAAAAAAAQTTVQQPPVLLLPESPKAFDGLGQPAVDPMRLASPGSRALSAPDLQQVVWQELQANTPEASLASAVGAAAPACVDSSNSVTDTWFASAAAPASAASAGGASLRAGAGALSPAKKSASMPGSMWRLAAPEQQYQHYQRYQYQQQQLRMQQLQQPQPFGARGISCPSAAVHMQQGYVGPSPPAISSSCSDNGSGAGAAGYQSGNVARWGSPAFNVPKRWSLELQRLGNSLTSQLLPGANKAEGGSNSSSSAGGGQQPHSKHHSRSNSRSMMHLPEEAPLSEAAIRILDNSLPALLGRTHHTHIGVAVPLSSSSGGGMVPSSMGPVSAYSGSSVQPTGSGSLSRGSSVHEHMGSLAASLAQQQEATAAAGGSVMGFPLGPLSHTDRESVASQCTDGALADVLACCLPGSAPEQQQQQGLVTDACKEAHEPRAAAAACASSLRVLNKSVSKQQLQEHEVLVPHRVQQPQFALDYAAASNQVDGATSMTSMTSLVSCTAQTAPAAYTYSTTCNTQQLHQLPLGSCDSEQVLQTELSFKAGVGPSISGQQPQHVEAAGLSVPLGMGLSLPPKSASKGSSSKLGSSWQAAGSTPKAAAAMPSSRRNSFQAASAASAGMAADASSGSGLIISLSPAATDCLLALGLSARLAGITEACRVAVAQGPSTNSGGGGSSRASGCGQLLRLLDEMAAPWAAEAAEAAASAASSTGEECQPDIVCRLIQGPDGLPRYKLDEDRIRQVQPALVVVACDEENSSSEEPHHQHYQQLKARGGAAGLTGLASAAASAAHHSCGSRSSNGSGVGSSTINGAVAVPGRVRLDAAVVQRVLQRAGVWGDGRAVVLYQRCHSLAEVLEFMQVLAQAAGVPERGAWLVQGLRARLRTAAARVCFASEARSHSSITRRISRSSLPGDLAGSAAASTAGAAAGSVVHLGPSRQLSVMVLDGIQPLRAAGFWVPEILQLSGADSGGTVAAAEPPHEMSWAQVRAATPELLVLALPGLPAGQAALHLAELAGLPGFWALPAVRAGAVYAVDHVLLLRPGPCLVLGVELLAHLAAPQQQPLPAGLPLGSVLKLSLHGGQRCRPRLVPHYMARYC